VRSAIYSAADARDRQTVHRALADATDPDAEPDRRAWHRAQAAVGPDEDVASELERSADRARGRGGVAAAAAFLERATILTPDPEQRGIRALATAQAKFEAAAPARAIEFLELAETCPLDALRRAQVARLRAQIVFAHRRGSDAPALLLAAAGLMLPLDAGLARETYLEALGAAMFAGRLDSLFGVVEIAKAACAASSSANSSRATDLLLNGLATRFAEGYTAGAPLLKRSVAAFTDPKRTTDQDVRWLWLACRIAPDVWDDESWHRLSDRHIRLSRDSGALSALPLALTYRAGVHVHAGEFAAAAALVKEADSIATVADVATLGYTSLVLVAWRGQESEALRTIHASIQDALSRGEGRAVALAGYASAVLYNGLGRYELALEAAQHVCEYDDIGPFGWTLIELIEAGVRSGARGPAVAALLALEERTRSANTDWALGIEARSRALLSDGEGAEFFYLEAVERLERTRIVVHLARARLVYGEWLRRERRRADAREQLRAAHDVFDSIGAEAFAERARRELVATGFSAHKRPVNLAYELTPQEAQIARLAGEGRTNREIGAQLFISARTVEWHLRKVFAKLDISSRHDLRDALA
jgi:DNA-binding CsgD family transcriptional regulator